MEKEYVVGSDSGTQSVKSIIFRLDGYPVGMGHHAHTLLMPRPNWVEQNPEEWWKAFCLSVKEAFAASNVSPNEIASIGITHQRCTLCAVDKDGKTLLPAQVWYDSRAIDQVRWVKEFFGAEKYMKIAGRMPDTTWWAMKAMWIKEKEPKIFERIHKLLTVSGYLIYKLTGEFKDSYAAPTGLLDMRHFKYSDELLKAFEIPKEKLCDIYAPGEIIGYVSRDASKNSGLPVSLPVAVGAGDQQAGGLGCGVTNPGTAYLNLGTSVVLGTVHNSYVSGKNFITREGAVPGTWNPECLVNGGYWLVTWFKENFGYPEVEAAKSCGLAPEEIMELEARKVPPGSLGLVLQPYWLGVRQPYWDEFAKGSIIGWRGIHTKAHFYRAIIEGIAYEVRLNLEGMEKALNTKIKDVRIFGGGARSDLSCGIFAEILNVPIRRLHTYETTTLGAAILAAVGAKLYKNVHDAAKAMSHTTSEFTAAAKNQKLYNSIYTKVYKRLYPSVRAIMRKIEEVEAEP